MDRDQNTDAFTQPERTTQEPVTEDFSLDESPPQKIGRFVVQQRLGQGGYATVHLAYDPDLDRLVALKLPRLDRFLAAAEVERYVTEARAAARLRHSGIVAVFDVNYDPGQLYIVLEYIEGQTLQQLLRTRRPDLLEAVELMIDVADAVAYAHDRGLVHRDLKPGNVLLDAKGRPHIADFGLAVYETGQQLKQGEIAGTPSYMAPEQVRGETHRLDRRTDIWSLGVILYRMLTGAYPFQGPEKSDVFEDVLTQDPKPPRKLDRHVPRELERICLKCLSKRMNDRYPTAADLADELRLWRQQSSGATVFSPDARGQLAPAATTSGSESAVSAGVRRPVIVVPKGLRAFDEDDQDFFLTLLPGPVDRAGLPDSIRFWKTQIEQKDRDKTFPVGLLYGPSGCGKSSLVRAGLIPQLAGSVCSVYVEATPDQTEARLLRALHRSCPDLAGEHTLAGAIMMLREQRCFPEGTDKLVLILDQFEQWLHAQRTEPGAELIQALRQCDGESIQAVISVRDDFWLGISRFFRALEIEIVEGRNSALVDLFDQRHATRVLAAFGRAFQALPDEDRDLSREQSAFLQRSVTGLARDGHVICVRLAMFAEMMKTRPWTWAELKAIGGTEGIGVSFLETAFYAKTAPPGRRVHQQGAQAVLKALLSEQSTELKGQVRSYGELLEASGYSRRPDEFDRLLGILDDELKLVTPVDAEERAENPATDQPPRAEEKHYQLTHDYLVPAVRQWLTRKQRETRRGQYEIRLAERTDFWTVKRERKQLPVWWEWLGIQLNTRKHLWTEPQRRMMRAATRWHLTRALLATIVLGLLVSAGFEIQGRFYSRALVDRLLTAENAEVPGILAEMADYQRWTKPLLTAKMELPEQDRRDDLRIRLALVSSDSSQGEPLMQHLLEGPPEEVQIVRDVLRPYYHQVADQAWSVLDNAELPPVRRLRAFCALAGWNAQDARWTDRAEQVVGWLLSESPLRLASWTTLLRPVDSHLLESLERAYRNDTDAVARCSAAIVLSDYLAGDPDHLLALIKDARPDQLRFITDNLSPLGEMFCDQLTRKLAELDRPELDNPASCSARANVAIALLKLGRGDAVWPLMDSSKDPTVRSYLIQRMMMADVDPSMLLDRLNNEPQVGVRRALLLSLGQYDHRLLARRFRDAMVQTGLGLYASDPDPGVHSASEWLLRQLDAEEQLEESWQRLAGQPPDAQRDWYVTSEGHTMARVTGPVEFLMGSPESDLERVFNEVLRPVTIDRSFAIATKELTIEQFLRFDPSYSTRMPDPLLKHPSIRPVRLTVHEAMSYCNWLSRQEGLSEDQWCYKEVKDRFEPHPDWLSRTGYRLTTEEEWEFACRAGTETSRFFGTDQALLPLYAWGIFNASGEVQPVGGLMPNDLGLFDVFGNVEEWCQERYTENPSTPPPLRTQLYVCRGGKTMSYQRNFRSASRGQWVGHQPGAGLRIARTLASVEK